MKKFLLIFSILILVTGIHAQDIKFMIGGSLSRYDIWPEVYLTETEEIKNEVSFKIGFLAGAGIEFVLAKNIAIEIDAMYLQKGSKYKYVYSYPAVDDIPDEIPSNFTFHVFSIPTLFKIKIWPKSALYMLGGGELSIEIAHRESPVHYLQSSIDISFTTKSLDYGFIFGAGYERKAKVGTFFIEGRCLLGLNNISKEPRPLYWETTKTRAIVVLAGFKI